GFSRPHRLTSSNLGWLLVDPPARQRKKRFDVLRMGEAMRSRTCAGIIPVVSVRRRSGRGHRRDEVPDYGLGDCRKGNTVKDATWSASLVIPLVTPEGAPIASSE